MKRMNYFYYLLTVLLCGVNYSLIGSDMYPQNSVDSVFVNSRWLPPVTKENSSKDTTNIKGESLIITISSIPDDAEIVSDSVIVGRTPAKIFYLSKLTLRKKGFAEREITPMMSEQIQSFELTGLAPQSKESFFQSNTFTLVSAAIILFGGTAAYLKIQADGKFEQYQRTGDDSFLSKTREYDLYSGLAFGVMQINFGYLVYKFLVNP